MDAHLRNILDTYKDMQGSTIVVLQEIQRAYGYLPKDSLEEFSRYYKISLADIYSVATFYSQFKFEKRGEKHIKVCHGTACHINGAAAISETIEEKLEIQAGQTTADGKHSLENVACLGCCSLAPVIMVDDKVYGGLDPNKAAKLIK